MQQYRKSLNKQELTDLRNELFDLMPTGKIDAFDMTVAVKNMLTHFDKVIDEMDEPVSAPSAQRGEFTGLEIGTIAYDAEADDLRITPNKTAAPVQSAGMQWVKGQYNELYAQVKSGSETPCLVDYKWDENTVCRDICRIKPHILELSARGICYGSIWQKDGQSEEEAFVIMCKSSNVEWLRESSSPSTVKEQDSEWKEQLQLAAHEREVLVKAFDKVRRLFELRSWIMEGRGSYPYNDDRYKEEVRYLYDEFDALVKDTWANIKTKSFEYQKWIIEEYLKENSSKEQETAIAFAKWMDHKGCWRNPMTTLYYLYGDNKGKDLPELYDLFIKSTTNGE